MNIKANKKNLKEHAKALLGVNHTEAAEAALIDACLNGFERGPRWAHISHDHAAHLEKIDKILGTHGVEGSVEPDIQYCNTGDTYALTILYYDGDLRIADWGSIVEEAEQAQEEAE